MIKTLKRYNKNIDWTNDQGSKLTNKDISNLKLNGKKKKVITESKSGFIKILSSLMMGQGVCDRGSKRINKGAGIDYDTGILLLKENGDIVNKWTPIIEVYWNSEITDGILKILRKVS